MFGPCTVAILLLIHVGTSDAAKRDVEQIKSDCKALGTKVKNLGAQIFSLIYR